MSPGRRSRELDDDLLLKIFSKVGCAWELARVASVCKRWRDLSCAVSYLNFDLEPATKQELKTMEGVICSVLCRASSRAPGNLKHLSVSFYCLESPAAEVHGHWLLWAMTMSLTKLELVATAYTVEWGPTVWNAIMRMKTLEELTIGGTLSTEPHLLLPQALANGLQMARLQYCNISCKEVQVALLETILATCPELTELCVCSVDSLAEALRVASNSLKTFSLDLSYGFHGFYRFHGSEVTVHAPRLTTLKLRCSPGIIHFESAQSLRTLSLEPLYNLYKLPENLQELELSGECDLQWLPKMLMLTPMITDLYLDMVFITGEGTMDIFASLVNLRNIHFYCKGMSDIRAGEKRLEALNVHLSAKRSFAPEVCWLKALIEVHKIQSLIVHCTGMMDHQAKTISKGYEEWRFLFELSYFYPGCVKLVN